MTRSEILDHAKAIVTKDREATHGQPERNLGLIAALWSAYLDREVTPVDVTMLMVLLKAARIKGNPVHIDSFTDICGYASLGGEMAAQPLVDPPASSFLEPGDPVWAEGQPAKVHWIDFSSARVCVVFEGSRNVRTYFLHEVTKVQPPVKL